MYIKHFAEAVINENFQGNKTNKQRSISVIVRIIIIIRHLKNIRKNTLLP